MAKLTQQEIEMVPGEGIVKVGASGVQMNEVAAVPGAAIAATEGRLWVKNDAPNRAMFTDDGGTDRTLAFTSEIPSAITPTWSLNFNLTAVTPYTMTVGEIIQVTTAASNDDIVLPGSPSQGDWVIIINNQTNQIEISGNGNNVPYSGTTIGDNIFATATGASNTFMTGDASSPIGAWTSGSRFVFDGTAWMQFNIPF